MSPKHLEFNKNKKKTLVTEHQFQSFSHQIKCQNKRLHSSQWDKCWEHLLPKIKFVVRVFPVAVAGSPLLVPRWSYFFLGMCSLVFHEETEDGESTSLAAPSKMSLTCSRLSACRINSSFTWRGRCRFIRQRFVVDYIIWKYPAKGT